jgi:hemerythrin
MAILNWSKEYSVDVQSIDREHQHLFAVLNELHDAMKVGKGTEIAPTVLGRLVAYTREHFANEESLMVRAAYPNFTNHKIEHDNLTSKVAKFMQDFNEGTAVLSMELLEFLRTWLQSHIGRCDKQYSRHLQSAGIR